MWKSEARSNIKDLIFLPITSIHFINIFPEGPTVFQTGKELSIEFQRILKYNFSVIIISNT